MSRPWSIVGLVWFMFAIAVPVAAAEAIVNFPSLDGATDLIGHLTRPEGDAPRPAVVLMHGCSGLNDKKGRMFGLYRAWARALAAQGYVTLIVDSATPRGLGQTCSRGPDARRMWRDRPKDAYGALGYLQGQPFVKPDRIALMGWSQGGGVALLSINDKSIGRPAALVQDFAVAVSFYPGVCADIYQSRPYTNVEPDSWTTRVPLLVLIGEADVWTPFKPCDAFIAAARARGNPVELKSYPGAVHAFDAPNLPRTELPQYQMHDGSIPVIGTDSEARKDAFPRVLDYLKQHLE
ncbi:dienelactone hydrolase family protein [Bradyrhizobium sp. th.b2]|uniref:dienelactone hydrolase family protein n=1 Tax=Bradyrhizobium sp. th-b2 TaxID=172088 RepID=UPI0004187777|nr:dienelactone hydrolase family protein [Bradyrhizobium sp. th.b2]